MHLALFRIWPSLSHHGNLQTLSLVRNIQFRKGVIERMPNFKVLKIWCEGDHSVTNIAEHHLENLAYLCQLENLNLSCEAYVNWAGMSLLRI